MKVVKLAAVYMDPAAYTHPYQFIEKVGRTCYKSEDRITDDSAAKFVSGLVSRAHWAMLEHGYIYMDLTYPWQEWFLSLDKRRLKYIHISRSNTKVSGSFRAFAEFLNGFEGVDGSAFTLRCILQDMYPEVFGALSDNDRRAMKYLTRNKEYFLTREEFISRCKKESDLEALRECLPHTVLFTADRGVTHELVRHRPASFAQESTRYCNYSKGKFGREIAVVEPFWAEGKEDTPMYRIWMQGCQDAERNYMAMLDAGAIPQEARALLPQSVKADIIVTATEKEWEHILNLRLYGTTGAPHPDIRRVMRLAAPQLMEHTVGLSRMDPPDNQD